jgi:ferredoxin
MIRVAVNRDTCSGFGTCLVASESIFDLDDEGLVVLKQELVGDEELAAVRQATYDCPTDSISFTEGVDGEA